MKKIIFFKNGQNWLDKTMTIKYRKLGLAVLCVAPVIIIATAARALYTRMEKDLSSIDITKGWGQEQPGDVIPEQTGNEDL